MNVLFFSSVKTFPVLYSMETSSAWFDEDLRQSVIEHMQELTGRQLDSDVIEMVLMEASWIGNEQLLLRYDAITGECESCYIDGMMVRYCCIICILYKNCTLAVLA